jgi:hypothetical protein
MEDERKSKTSKKRKNLHKLDWINLEMNLKVE